MISKTPGPARHPLRWHFPLPRPYTGILLGNGTLGLMVWGHHHLCVSIARNGFWDRRGGIPFAAQVNFRQVRTLLEESRMDELKRAFTAPGESTASPPYRTPTQIPGGRMEIHYNATPQLATLDHTRSLLRVELADSSCVELRIHPERELAWLGGNATPIQISLIPAWHWLGETLSAGGVAPPHMWSDGNHGGFRQTLPEDPALTVQWRASSDGILVATHLGESASEAFASAEEIHSAADSWWSSYQATVPAVDLPDAALQRAWDYGIHKMAGMTPPQGVAAPLQGPWMSETELPPWSNDYHFNINLQMIYWPALPTNRPEHFKPVWRMLQGWLPQLRANAESFFGTPKALMLPHAVDDRGQVVGNFWQGTIDQACTAWMAQLAWLHYRHTMDDEILRDTVWPLLVGAFEGFWAMIEERDGKLALPVSVSAEFGDWGRNASFQLAALHMLADILPRAAATLRQAVDPRWARVRRDLPAWSSMPLAKVWGEDTLRPRIVLWEGQDLPESHRHHSHLAGIYPFCTIDPEQTETRDLVRRSIEHWSATGPGQWVGWSLPWAAIIWARCNHASATVSILRIWEDVFTNQGGGTLHNADSPGYSSWVHSPFFDWPETARDHDQMQMDAAFGVLQAIVEIFVQQRGCWLHILPSLPKQWRQFSFDGILCEGAFLAGATVEESSVREVRITSTRGGRLRLKFTEPMNREQWTDVCFDVATSKGEVLIFRGPSQQAH